MAEETYTVELIVDTGSSVATVQALGNVIAKLKADFPELAAVLGRVEQQLGKYAGTATNATATTQRLAAEETKAAAAADKQAAAEEKKAVALAAAADKQAAAEEKKAVALANSNGQLDAHVRSYQAYNATLAEAAAGLDRVAAAEAFASQQTALYNQYLYDEVKALTGVSLSTDQLAAGTYDAAKAEALAARNTQIYNQALFEQDALLKRSAQGLSTTRYALFSAAGSLAGFGAGLLALSVLPAVVATNFQKEFAQVARTVTGAGKETEDALISLSQRIPVTFKELASIASLGGQLGIQKDGIVQFTQTVAELTATTNLTADAAGTALGRFEAFGLINNDQFGNLASSILKVGVSTVATESQIVTISTRIAGIAKIAGLSAPEIVGFAGAVASVGIQPYAAQGSITRFFTSIGQAASTGGAKLDEFAKLAGTSSDSVKEAYGTSKFGPIFQSFLKGLSDTAVNGGSASKALEALGIHGSTDLRVFTQLAGASDLVQKSFALGTQGFKDTSTLADQYGKIAGTTASKITILGNSFLTLFNSIGSAQTGPVAGAVEKLTDSLNGLSKLTSTSGGQLFLGITSGAGIFIGVLALVAAGLLRGAAGIIGITQALAGYTGVAVTSSTITGGLSEQLAGMGAAGRVAAAGVNVASVAIKGLGIAGLALLGLQIDTWGADALGGLRNLALGIDTGLNPSLERLKKSQDFKAGLNGGFIGWVESVNRTLADSPIHSVTSVLTDDTKRVDDAFASLAQSGNVDSVKQQLTSLAEAQGVSVTKLLTQLPQTKQALADYKIATKGATDQTATLAAQQKLLAAQQQSTADAIGITTDELTQLSKGLVSGSSAFVSFDSIISSTGGDTIDGFSKNLQSSVDAQSTWADNLGILAARGATSFVTQLAPLGPKGAAIAAEAVNLTTDQLDKLEANAELAGFLSSKAFADAFESNTPNLIAAYKAGGVGAVQAFIDAQISGAPGAIAAVVAKYGIKGIPLPITADPAPAIEQVQHFIDSVTGRRIPLNVDPSIASAQSILNKFIASNDGRTIALNATVGGSVPRNLRQYPNAATGGYISGPGTGTSDSIPAMISNGEYVIKAASVRQYGAGLFDALNRGVAHFASGGYVGQSQQSAPAVSGSGVNVSIVQNNPVTRDPIKQLKDDAANVLAGIWA